MKTNKNLKAQMARLTRPSKGWLQTEMDMIDEEQIEADEMPCVDPLEDQDGDVWNPNYRILFNPN